MDYKILLNGYKRLPINIRDYVNLLNENYSGDGYVILNERLHSYLSYNFNIILTDIVNNIFITEDGLKLDLSNLKKYLCSYFNLKNDERLLQRLDELEEKIINNDIDIINISSRTRYSYENYKFKKFIPNNGKKPKVKKKEFRGQLRRDIVFFRDLLINEDKYANVVDCFDQNKVNLYLAYVIMNYVEECKKNEDIKKYNYALRYLKEYIKNNKELIDINFGIGWFKPSICISNSEKERYTILKVIEYLENIQLKDRKNEELKKVDEKKLGNDVEKFNYSFFECDGEKAREILGKYFRYFEDGNIDEELKLLLKRKIKLYESLNYQKIKIGIESFDGYIGFQLENGYVILDKLYENIKEGKIAVNNAIYIVKVEDFEKITRMSKLQTIEAIENGLINAKRIIHSGDYESRVKRYIKKI